MAQIVRPAEIEVVMDINNRTYVAGVRPFTVWSQARTKEMAPTVDLSSNSAVHLEGGNAVYADGHAKWRNRGALLGINPTQVVAGMSSAACVLGSDGKPTQATKHYPNCHPAWNPYY